MILFNIAVNNIKKKFKRYLGFLLGTSFSMFALYLFTSIVNNKSVQDQFKTMKGFMDIFNISLYLIAFFSIYFIYYANSFFIKWRKKEFATYMLLGMSKRQTAILNLIENTAIMLLALITGILIGVIFNKFFVMIIFSLIKSGSKAEFYWSFKAFNFCLIIFAIVFVIISIQGTVLIYKDNLIDLFNASKKSEKGLKVSLFSLIISILSIICIGEGYYLAIKKASLDITLLPVVVLLVVVGTILLFTTTVSFIIYLSKRNEKSLYKGTKLISTSQLFFRYKGNVGTLSMIAVTTSVALCALITCYSLLGQNAQNSRNMRPFSIEYLTSSDSDKIFKDTLKKHDSVSVSSQDKIEFINVKAKNEFYNNHEDQLLVLNESEYNNICEHQGKGQKTHLSSEEETYFFQISSMETNKNAIGKKISLNTGSNNYTLNISGTDKRSIISLENAGECIVVKDSLYNKIKGEVSDKDKRKITGVMLNSELFSKAFVTDLRKSMPKDSSLQTYYEFYMDGLKLQGIMVFAGSFIGILFILATGSIIYFKMSMEAEEDKNKFLTLSKIGVSNKEIKNAVSKELLVIFGLPFLIAAINTVVASVPLSKMNQFSATNETIAVIIIYGLFYGIYYLVTLKFYMKTVTK